jgi:iron complex outermembrane receptor protein
MTLEDLMRLRIEPVFGASRRQQPVTDAPASVTIVTADDIARHGYRTLADVLRGVRGFYASYDRNYTYLGVNGFSLPGDYNTRILLLVDGHRMNDNVYEQAQAGPEMGLDPATFDRVEVIRGPASSLYGTNAFFGVVNVITKSGAAVNGVRFDVDGGSLGARSVRVAAGRELRADLDFAVFAHAGRSSGPRQLYFPEFDAPDTNAGVVAGLDDESERQVSGRLRAGHFALRGAFGVRDKQVPTAAFGTLFGDTRFRTHDERLYADGEYDRSFGATRVVVHASADRARYHGDYPEDAGLNRDYADGIWTGAEGRVTRPLAGRHTLTLGGEWRQNIRQRQGAAYQEDPSSAFQFDGSSTVLAAYAQDEIALTSKLTLNAGLRVDRYADFVRLAPRVAVIVKPSDNGAIKYLYGNAFRAPNAYERFYYPPAVGTLRPETIDSHELIWERYTGTWLRTSASAYFNRVDRLIVLTGNDDDLAFANRDRVHGTGVGLEAEVRVGSTLKLLGSYVRQATENRSTGERLSNSPAHAAALALSATGPFRLETGVDIRALGERQTLAGTALPASVVVDAAARLPLRRGMVLTAAARNLFDARYSDPGSEEHRQLAIPQDGRSARLGLEWSFAVK